MTVNAKLMTADELSRLPRGRERHELVRGVLRTMPLATWPEAIPANNFIHSLRPYESDRRPHAVLTSVGFQLSWDPDTVRAPDVAFLSPRRLCEVEGVTGYIPGVPDLAVEVISPTDLYLDVQDTIAEWLEHGTQVVFVVNPRRNVVAVHRPGQPVVILDMDDTLTAEDVVPGWSLAVRDLLTTHSERNTRPVNSVGPGIKFEQAEASDDRHLFGYQNLDRVLIEEIRKIRTRRLTFRRSERCLEGFGAVKPQLCDPIVR